MKKDTYQNNTTILSEAEEEISNLLSVIVQNIEPHSYQVCIKEGRVINLDHSSDGASYYTYAYFGKQSNNKLRVNALSYAYKLARFLNNKKRLRVMTGGGVVRKKKLQMGSVVPLVNQGSG